MSGNPGASAKLRTLITSLTKREFSVVWAVEQFQDAEEYSEAFSGLSSSEWSTPGFEERGFLLVERYCRVIRWLSSLGFRFKWIRVGLGTGSITRQGSTFEPGNEAYLGAILSNKVDFERNSQRAAVLLNDQNVQPLARVMADIHQEVKRSIEARKMVTDLEKVKAWEAQNDEALASLGVVRSGTIKGEKR